VTRLRTGQLRKLSAGVRDLSLPIQTGSGDFHISYAMDTGFFPWGVKLLSREADHLPVYCGKIKNDGSYTSVCPCAFMAHRNIFTFKLSLLLPLH
jgi:hypothetical protein